MGIIMEKTEKLQKLCDKINMPEQATKRIIETAGTYHFPIADEMQKLTSQANWMEGLKNLIEIFGEDPGGWKMLTCMLNVSFYTKEKYHELGINDEIFYSTMGCFSRFVREHKQSFGDYGFDRAWWTVRQLSCLLFHLGTLEFEIGKFKDEPSISIHIPSDADISKENCKASIKNALEFFKTNFPEFQFKHMSCSSWLLSPNLKQVLKEDSKILQFQNMFQILEVQPDDKEYIRWIFQDNNLEISQLPEHTSLQRNVKKYMQDGNNIGSASGTVILMF